MHCVLQLKILPATKKRSPLQNTCQENAFLIGGGAINVRKKGLAHRFGKRANQEQQRSNNYVFQKQVSTYWPRFFLAVACLINLQCVREGRRSWSAQNLCTPTAPELFRCDPLIKPLHVAYMEMHKQNEPLDPLQYGHSYWVSHGAQLLLPRSPSFFVRRPLVQKGTL